MIIDLELEELSRIFDFNYVLRGINYAKDGMVLSSKVEGSKIIATVNGSGRSIYQCIVSVNYDARAISGSCSCPIGLNCKHIVAVIVDHINHQHDTSPNVVPLQKASRVQLSMPVNNWLRSIQIPNEKAPEKKQKDELRFILDVDTNFRFGRHLAITAVKTRLLKSGGWGKTYPLKLGSNTTASYLTPEDHNLLSLLEMSMQSSSGQGNKQPSALLAYTLDKLIVSKRLHWQNLDLCPIRYSEEYHGTLDWQLQDDEVQVQVVDQPTMVILPVEPALYFDSNDQTIGPLVTDLSVDIEQALTTAPAIPIEHCTQVRQTLEQAFPKSNIAVPKVEVKAVKQDVAPIPCLNLLSEQEETFFSYNNARYGGYQDYDDYADLYFDYQGINVSPLLDDEIVSHHVDGNIEQIARQLDKEKEWVQALLGIDLAIEDVTEQPQDALRFYHPDEDKGWMDFSVISVPELRKQGWQVMIDPSFRFDVINAEEWYADLEGGTGEDWFNLELGVKIDGESISLLPVLVNFIQQQTRAKTMHSYLELPDEYTLFMTLEDGRIIRTELGKVRHIIETLVELYDPNILNDEGKLKLSRYQAGQLNALDEGNMQWAGEDAPRLFADKLAGFKEISNVSVPKALQTTLRPYQQQGLDWLQFLREYDLSGILADEMGLGKTVQTLAHILKEKESSRMTQPCLVVATTSLMVNWANEVKQFAPSLKVLISQGDNRKQHFDTFYDYDLVLTTYPLLPRDSEFLTAQHWHILILDEAQYIKNPRSKVAEIARQLNANHRLCLTGTPMENHLGEVWSQFHFLMPGLLGGEKQFRNLFRKPIENLGDDARQQQLNKRIAPFMLRREKSLVAKELPEKNEIISTVELAGRQRQLYETIRVSMTEKVRKEIDKKGIARSQIVILDALLKLRQVCCDPRLLKLDAAQKVKQSAKLEQLMEILPEMIAEGRRILLFSQFTSMLSLIEEELLKRDINYVKLTGQTKDRVSPINRFQNKEVPLFLISLKAGGAGLNLTAADTVIHYDPWWNPAVEAQATDRAHRIGQKNKVFVYKLITAGSVEEKINALQQKKKALANALFGTAKQADKLTEKDLQALFEPLV